MGSCDVFFNMGLFDNIFGKTPETAEGWFQKAEDMFHKGKTRESIKCYTRATEIDPDFKEAWNNLGNAYAQISENENALICFDKALMTNLNAQSVIRRKEKFSDLTYDIKTRDGTKPAPLQDDVILMNKGVALRNLNKINESLESLNKALSMNPGSSILWNAKGNTLTISNKYQEAVVCYEKSLLLNPNDAPTWKNKGVALFSLGRLDDALTCMNKALQINPKDVDAKMKKEYILSHINKK